MTGIGGLLLLVDRRPAPRLDGISLPALVAAGSTSGEPALQSRVPLRRGQWQAIVIHHSGSPAGKPADIAAQHEALGYRGLGHHFIIGNGRGMDDGELHVGFRWLDQLYGAHAGGPDGDWYNRHSISICLVGDGNRRPFTPAQMRRLMQVVGALCRELGIPPERVVLHSEIAPTTDPGRLFPTGMLREGLVGLR